MLRDNAPHGALAFMRMEHAVLSLAKGLILKCPEWTEQEAVVLMSHLRSLLTIAVEFRQAREHRERRRFPVSSSEGTAEAAELSQMIFTSAQFMQVQLQSNQDLNGKLGDQLEMILKLYVPYDASPTVSTDTHEEGELLTGVEDLAYIAQMPASNPVLFKGKKLNIKSKSKGASRQQAVSSSAVTHRIRVRVGNTTYEK